MEVWKNCSRRFHVSANATRNISAIPFAFALGNVFRSNFSTQPCFVAPQAISGLAKGISFDTLFPLLWREDRARNPFGEGSNNKEEEMKRSFLICALLLGAGVGHSVLARAETISPAGTWQVSILGSEKGTLMMTFSNNFTVSGYGITRKRFGFITLVGNWSVDSKGDVVVGCVQTVNSNGTAYSLTMHMLSSSRFRGKATGSSGGYRCKGEQPLSFPHLSGSWNGVVKRKGKPLLESFTATVSSNYPAVFDVSGQGLSEAGSYTLSGAIIVSSHNAVNASLNRTFAADTQDSTLSGVFKSSKPKILMSGTDDAHARLSETAVLGAILDPP